MSYLRTWVAVGACLGQLCGSLTNAGAAEAAEVNFSGAGEQRHESTLPNGIRCVVTVDRRVPLAAVAIAYGIGRASDPPLHPGLARAMAQLLPSISTRHISESQRRKLYLAAGIPYKLPEARVNSDTTVLSLVVPSEAVDLALFIEADRMAFADDGVRSSAVASASDAAAGEVRRAKENHDAGGLEQWVAFGADDPYATEVRDFNLSRLTPRHVQDQLRRYYQPGNAVVAVQGDVEPEAIIASLRRHFGALKGTPVAPLPTTPKPPSQTRVVTEEGNFTGPGTTLIWSTPAYMSAADLALDVVAQYLRKKLEPLFQVGGICARGGFRQISKARASYFFANCIYAPGHVDPEFEALVNGELTRMAAEEFDQALLKTARTMALTSALDNFQSLSGAARIAAESLWLDQEPKGASHVLQGYTSVDAANLATVVRTTLRAKPVGTIRYTPNIDSSAVTSRTGFAQPVVPLRAAPDPVQQADTRHWYRAPLLGKSRGYSFDWKTDVLRPGATLRFARHPSVPLTLININVGWSAPVVGLQTRRELLQSLYASKDTAGRDFGARLAQVESTLAWSHDGDGLSILITSPAARVDDALKVVTDTLALERLEVTTDSTKARIPAPTEWMLNTRKMLAVAYPRDYRYGVDRQSTALAWRDTQRWWKRQQSEAALDISIVGGISHDEARRAAAAAVDKLALGRHQGRPEKPFAPKPGIHLIQNDSMNDIESVIVWPKLARYERAGVAESLMVNMLASEQPEAWRGQLAKVGSSEPTWNSNTSLRTYGNLFYVTLSASHYKFVSALAALKLHFEYLGRGTLNQAEVRAAWRSERQFFLGQWSTSLGASWEQYRAANQRADAEQAPLLLDMLGQTSAETVAGAARSMPWNKACIVVEGNLKSVRAELEKLGLPVFEVGPDELAKRSKP